MQKAIEASKQYHKKTALQAMDVELGKLRHYLRSSRALGFLPPKKDVILSGMTGEFGSLLGGWITYTAENPVLYKRFIYLSLSFRGQAVSRSVVATGTMPLLRVCSRCTSLMRGRTPTRTSVSAPLSLAVRYCIPTGCAFSTGRKRSLPPRRRSTPRRNSGGAVVRAKNKNRREAESRRLKPKSVKCGKFERSVR